MKGNPKVLQRARPAVWEDDKWKEAVVVDVALSAESSHIGFNTLTLKDAPTLKDVVTLTLSHTCYIVIIDQK